MAVASVREPGPWTHQNLSAAGASFHVASMGTGPHTVLFLHDFPLFWWSWRHQLPAVSAAGYRAVAMDLRGYGGSDFQPGDVTLTRLATDVSAVAQTLGARTYSIVGAGMGGAPGWMAAHRKDPALLSLLQVASPHPRSRATSGVRPGTANLWGSRYWRQPRRGPRGLQEGTLIRELLTDWSGPNNTAQVTEQAPTYAQPMSRHFAAESAWETLNATRRVRLWERKFLGGRIDIPIWSVRGEQDPHCLPADLSSDRSFTARPVTHFEVPGSGHFVSEEQPQALTEIILDHLHQVEAPH